MRLILVEGEYDGGRWTLLLLDEGGVFLAGNLGAEGPLGILNCVEWVLYSRCSRIIHRLKPRKRLFKAREGYR
jgi:hypothetical protein